MGQSGAGRGRSSAGVSTSILLAGKSFPKRVELGAEVGEGQDGPDYVDLWMRRNLEDSLVDFVQRCCTSFVRWDLLRRLHADRRWSTPESLARAIGANHMSAEVELERLVSLGILNSRHRGRRTSYQLDDKATLSRALDSAISAYDSSQEFRFALVYSIVRATHRGTIVD